MSLTGAFFFLYNADLSRLRDHGSDGITAAARAPASTCIAWMADQRVKSAMPLAADPRPPQPPCRRVTLLSRQQASAASNRAAVSIQRHLTTQGAQHKASRHPQSQLWHPARWANRRRAGLPPWRPSARQPPPQLPAVAIAPSTKIHRTAQGHQARQPVDSACSPTCSRAHRTGAPGWPQGKAQLLCQLIQPQAHRFMQARSPQCCFGNGVRLGYGRAGKRRKDSSKTVDTKDAFDSSFDRECLAVNW